MNKKIKVCLTCCAGGHFQQMRLATDSVLSPEKYDIYWIMHKSNHLASFFKDKRLYIVMNTTNNKLTWIINAIQSLLLLIKERPDVIISTGAGVSFPTIFFGKKIFHCKVIYLCSAANVTKPSRTPYQAYKYSDLFLVQWPEMKNIFPKSIYIDAL